MINTDFYWSTSNQISALNVRIKQLEDECERYKGIHELDIEYLQKANDTNSKALVMNERLRQDIEAEKKSSKELASKMQQLRIKLGRIEQVISSESNGYIANNQCLSSIKKILEV